MCDNGWTRRTGLVLAWVLAGFAGGAGPMRADAPLRSADEILAAADRSRNGWDSFSVDVKITNYKKDRVVSSSSYEVLIKGADKTLVRFADPSDKGKLLLMLEDAMWLYMPSTSRPIRVTALQRLSGNASNGDVAQTSLLANYSATLAGQETLDGRPAYVLELLARRKSATYQKVRYWVAQGTLLPLKAEFQLGSGKPSKAVRRRARSTTPVSSFHGTWPSTSAYAAATPWSSRAAMAAPSSAPPASSRTSRRRWAPSS